jgi:anti-sigma regulatory factor (Ser/Thr protein kinase)
VSELVNNAVLHGQGQITMKAEADGRQVCVDVIDDGTGLSATSDTQGLTPWAAVGCSLVEAESSRWGITEGTTDVWFELERRGPRLGPQRP